MLAPGQAARQRAATATRAALRRRRDFQRRSPLRSHRGTFTRAARVEWFEALGRRQQERPSRRSALAIEDELSAQHAQSPALKRDPADTAPRSREAQRPRRAPPASNLACAAASARAPCRAGSGVSWAARSRNAAVAATPPRACARAAERSSSPATASSGTTAARARCHARRSGSSSGSVTSASALWTARRSCVDASR